MSSEWVDFKAVKQSVSMEMILAHYNVRVRKVNQTYLRGRCPLPTHTSGESANSFGVDTGKNAWACQSASCVNARAGRKGGNVLDFVAAMENCSIREAAVRMQNWFSVTPASSTESVGQKRELVSEGRGQGSEASPPESNKPLSFELKGVESSHEYLAKRGIARETASFFGVGLFPGRGSMAGRVVIPIHNAAGQLVAYAGRSVDGSEPRYKMPGGFHKSLELFNIHRALAPSESMAHTVIVVEGFFDCMKVRQAGYPRVVALMGSTMSEPQERILAREFAYVILMLDGDEPGREAATEIAARLVRRTFVKVINLTDGTQPDQLSSEQLQSILGSL